MPSHIKRTWSISQMLFVHSTRNGRENKSEI